MAERVEVLVRKKSQWGGREEINKNARECLGGLESRSMGPNCERTKSTYGATKNQATYGALVASAASALRGPLTRTLSKITAGPTEEAEQMPTSMRPC